MAEKRGRRARRAAAAPPTAARRAAPEASPPWSWPGVVVVAAVAVGLYANTLGHELFYDDVNAIVRNAWVHEGDPVAIVTQPSWWAEGHGRGWRPVTTLSFALNYALHELAPAGYHALNVLLHTGVSVLVLVVLARATGHGAAALAAALLFAAHPIHTEVVASAVGRAELLAALGFFAAWGCVLRARASGRPFGWDVGAVAALLLAAAAKENALALLPVLLLADLVTGAGAGSPRAWLGREWPRYLGLAAASAVFVVVHGAVIGSDPPPIDRLDNPLVALPLATRLATTVKVVALYGWRLLVPLRLAADYSYEQIAPVASLTEGAFVAGAVILVAVPVVVWRMRRRAPAVALGLGFMALTFAMVSNLLVPIGTIMAERLLYLPSAGFCLAVGALLVRAAGGRVVATRHPAARAAPAALVAVGVVVLLYGVRTVDRNRVWRDPALFFATMVADAPRSARAHREYGGVLADAGRFDDAERAFARSLAIKPGDAATLFNLGNARLRAGRIDRAIESYRAALAAKPAFADALVNLGNAESLRGEHRAALDALQRALELTPRSASLHMNVANTHFRLGEHERARAAYARALELAPTSTLLLTNYGAFLYAHGEYEAAAELYARATRARDGQARAWVGLVSSQHALGRVAEAGAALAEARRRFPDDPSLGRLAAALATGPTP